GQMKDRILAGCFNTAEQQVIILASVILRTQAAGRIDDILSYDGKMVEVVLRVEQLPIPSSFHVRLEAISMLVDLVLVGVDQTRRRIVDDAIGYERKGVSAKKVVMVHEGDPIASCELERGIGSAGYSTVRF